MDNPRALHDLRRYWDALVLGKPASPGQIDPESAALLQQLHTLPDGQPDPAYARDLRERLMHTATNPFAPPIPPSLNGKLAPRPSDLPLAIPLPRRPRRAWPLAQAAIVLLIVAAIVATYFMTLRPQSEPTFAPAVGTPLPAGNSDDWPMFRGNPGHNSANAGPGPQGSPVEVWTYHASGPVSRSPAVADGTVYLQSGDGLVTALDAATGEVRWQNAETNVGENTPTGAGDTLYLTNVDGELIALDRETGSEKWRFAQPVSAESLPTVVDRVVYVGSEEGHLFAVDAATGEERWQVQATGGIYRSVSVQDDVLYFGTMNGHVEARRVADGAPIWQAGTTTPDLTIGTPALANGIVYAQLPPGTAALDAATGKVLWSSAPIQGNIANSVTNNLLFSGREDGSVRALDARSGEERWVFPTGGKVQAAPAVTGDSVYVASFDRSLYALDAATGQERWTFDLDGAVTYGPSIANGMLYIGTDAGTLFAIGGSGAEQLAAQQGVAPAVTSRASPTAPTALEDSTPVQLLWQYVDPEQRVSGISGISLAPDGNVWITDGPAGQLVILTPEGEIADRWGSPGDGPGQFNFRRDDGNAFGLVTFAPDGSFYVADSHNFRVQHFAADRTFLDAFGEFGSKDGQFQEPIQVLRDAVGNLYVIDDKRDDVQKFAPDGTFLLKFGGHGDEPGQLSNAGAGGIDPEGNIWIGDGDNARLQKFSPEGELLQTIEGTTGTLQSPSGFAIDDAGRLWVGDYGNSKVEVFAPDGALLLVLDGIEGGGTRFDGANNLIMDGKGHLYVHEYGSHESVRKYLLLDPEVGGTPVP